MKVLIFKTLNISLIFSFNTIAFFLNSSIKRSDTYIYLIPIKIQFLSP